MCNIIFMNYILLSDAATSADEVLIVAPQKLSWRERFIYAMIGPPEGVMSQQEEKSQIRESFADRQKFMEQTPLMNRILNVNAVIVMALCAFLYGFFH